MVWFVLAFIGGLLETAFYSIYKKHAGKANLDEFSAASYFFAGVIALAVSIFYGIPQITGTFLAVMAVYILLNSFFVILYQRALELSDISLVLPILSLTPAFQIVVSSFFGGFVSPFGAFGILILVFGIFLTNYTKKISLEKGVIIMIFGALVAAVLNDLNKITIIYSDVIFAAALSYLGLGIFFFAKTGFATTQLRKRFRWLLSAGMILAAAGLILNIALLIGIVPYVISLKRLGLVSGSSVAGRFFGEKHLMLRLAGGIVMVLGTAIILLYG